MSTKQHLFCGGGGPQWGHLLWAAVSQTRLFPYGRSWYFHKKRASSCELPVKIMDTGKPRTVTPRISSDFSKGKNALWICLNDGKVRFYYICNYSEFRQVSVSLRKLKHLSSWARGVMTYLLMWDWRFNRQRNRLRPQKYMYRKTGREQPKI